MRKSSRPSPAVDRPGPPAANAPPRQQHQQFQQQQSMPKSQPAKPQGEIHTGHGADSALERMKQWERGRAAQGGRGGDKPSNDRW